MKSSGKSDNKNISTEKSDKNNTIAQNSTENVNDNKNKQIDRLGVKNKITTSRPLETRSSKSDDSTLKTGIEIKEKGVNITELKENVTVTEVFVKNKNLTNNRTESKGKG
jgi:hypothetical protein